MMPFCDALSCVQYAIFDERILANLFTQGGLRSQDSIRHIHPQKPRHSKCISSVIGEPPARDNSGKCPMPRVIEINDFDQLTGYRLAWHKLLAETRNASYFQSLDWLDAYWQYFGPGQKMKVLVVRSGDE